MGEGEKTSDNVFYRQPRASESTSLSVSGYHIATFTVLMYNIIV